MVCQDGCAGRADIICNACRQEPFASFAGKSFPNMNSFQAHLKEVWFTLYPRSNNWSKAIDSSGFEHIFLGESKGKQQSIGGLHNWIGAYLLEQKGTLDYTGYISYTKLSQVTRVDADL